HNQRTLRDRMASRLRAPRHGPRRPGRRCGQKWPEMVARHKADSSAVLTMCPSPTSHLSVPDTSVTFYSGNTFASNGLAMGSAVEAESQLNVKSKERRPSLCGAPPGSSPARAAGPVDECHPRRFDCCAQTF